MDDLSYEDLVEYALGLQKTVEDRDESIAELSAGQTGRGRGRKGDDDLQEELQDEVEDLRTRGESDQLAISDLREQLSTANVKLNALTSEKAETEKKQKQQAKRIEELEKEIVEVNTKSRTTDLQSREFNKQKTANVKEAQRLFEENETFKEEIRELEETLGSLEEEKSMMEQLVAKLADDKDELGSKLDGFEVERLELQTNAIEMEKQLEETQLLLQISSGKEGEQVLRIEVLGGELKVARDRVAADQRAAQVEQKRLQDQITLLKDSTQVGEKQRALESLQAETKDNNKLIEDIHNELESTLAERDVLSGKLLELEEGIEQRVVDRITAEKERTKQLQLDIETLKSHHGDNMDHYASLEEERDQLAREVDELTSWKAVYEAGKGMTEISRTHKKLKEDNRRLSMAVEQYNNKLSVAMNANEVLTQAFNRLKKETGKPANFSYPEYALQEEVQSTSASLTAQLAEVEEQLLSLETENTRLRGAMKNHAASIGEAGFKYAGMSPDMLLMVNDFAANIRSGKTELPLNDRSQVLLKENRGLRDDVQAMRLRADRYEAELVATRHTPREERRVSPRASFTAAGGEGGGGGGEGGGGGGEDWQVAQVQALAGALESKMESLGADIAQLTQQHAAAESGGTAGMIPVSELGRILTQNNQLILRELDRLKNQHFSGNEGAGTGGGGMGGMGGSMGSPTGRSKSMSNAMNRAQQSYGYTSKHEFVPAATPQVQVPTTPAPTGVKFTVPESVAGGERAMWTPAMARGGMPFYGTQNAVKGRDTGMQAGPATPHGKQLLTNSLHQMNLPPEEWAVDVRDLNAQLIECLEQLYEREQELEDSFAITSTMEETLVGIKQQMTALYYDFANKADGWDTQEAAYKKDAVQVRDERDDLKLKLRRMQDMSELLQREDKDAIAVRLTELTRKMTVYEVNESVLSRRFIAQGEQLLTEQRDREQLQIDFVEMEAALKKRVLYLEQYKLAAGSRIGHLQGRVDCSVAQADYLALQQEIDVLREDHLNTLRREIEARMAALKSLDNARELQSARIIAAHLQAELEGAGSRQRNCEAELQHQRSLTQKALSAAGSSAEVSNLVSELARFRGEASRLEVELMGSNRRAELVGEKMSEVTRDFEEAATRVRELERREDELSVKESSARKAALEMSLLYQDGLTREAAEEVRAKLDKTQRGMEEAQRETVKFRELADIATQQAQALSGYRQQSSDDLSEMREYCGKLESRGDDELLIGRLQRQLMSTKTSYKSFVRKYHHARECMRKRELAMRVLEKRLDEQETLGAKQSEASRLETGALKKALRNLKNTVFEGQEHRAGTGAAGAGVRGSKDLRKGRRSSFATVTVGEKLVDVSVKVDELAVQAEDAVNRAAASEQESRLLQGQVEDLVAERHILEQQVRDLEAVTRGKSKQAAIAARLIALSDDMRVSKVSNLQQRRQIQTLRQEKRHLQGVISNIEADVLELEEGKVAAETKRIMFDISEKAGDSGDEEFSHALLDFAKLDEDEGEQGHKGATPATARGDSGDIPQRQSMYAEDKLSLDMQLISPDSEKPLATPEQAYHKLQAAHAQMAEHRREISEQKLRIGQMQNQLNDGEALLQERDGQVNYYERVLSEEGMPAVLLRNQPARRNGPPPQPGGRQYKLMAGEQEKLQEAATATIGSLRSLLEEKNRIIDRYRDRADKVVGEAPKSRAEKRAGDLLDRIAADEGEEARARRYGQQLYPEVFSGGVGHADEAERSHLKGLQEHVAQADSIIAEKDRLLGQVEQRLATEAAGRERAEVRCGESLKEMEAMQEDMVTLVQQLQESQARAAHLGKTSSTRALVPAADPRLKELEKLVRAKDDKVRGYREIIVKLKDEFIKAEEDKAAAEVRLKAREAGEYSTPSALSTDEMKALKSKLSDLHDGLSHAKDDLEKARRVRERLTLEKRAAEEQLLKVEADAHQAELQKVSAQNAYHRLRKELEDSRRKEVRLREKLKEVLGGEGPSKETLAKARERIEAMERETDLLKTQNAALKRGGESKRDEAETGHVLGTGGGDMDETRQQLHAKWEAEKKLSKRVGVLEKRLQEKIAENEDLLLQVARGRDTLQSAITAKDDITRKAQQSQRQVAETRRVTGDDLGELEQANARVFQMEDELVRLRRTAHVEQSNELAALGHQVSVQRARIGELEAELAESEGRRKRAAAGAGAGAGGGGAASARQLRESEDAYMREERIKDDLDLARRQKLELEAALLDRDARAIEGKFDLEASELEAQRLRRRVKELEIAYKSVSSLGQSGKGPTGAGAPKGARKEQELEGVVEAMKRVVDKLKTENDRLKRAGGGVEERRIADLERRLGGEKKKAEELEEEARTLRAKMKGHEESGQKIVQRQQQVAMLRRQMKVKEDEMAAAREASEDVIVERETLKKKAGQLQNRVNELEVTLHKAQQSRASLGVPPSGGGDAAQQREVRDLREQNDELRDAVRRMREELEVASNRPGVRGASAPAGAGASGVEARALHEENQRLRQELAAFDLDFFEEIENLKYAHAEAVRKLRMYESAGPGREGRLGY